MMDFLISHIDTVVALLGLIVAAIMATPWAKAWREKVKAIVAANNLTAAFDLACGVVSGVESDFVQVAKANGTWDATAKTQALNKATDRLRTAVAENGLQIAADVLPGLCEKALIALGMSSGQRSA